jgi:hypothetical protein
MKWINGFGADNELRRAEQRKIKIFYSLEEIKDETYKNQ